MELFEFKALVQNRAAFRTTLSPSELGLSRLWVHDPGTRFSEENLAPAHYMMLLEKGISLVNVSAVGALARILTEPNFGLFRIVAQPAEELHGGISLFRDVSLTINIELRKDLRDIYVTGSIVRSTLVKTSPEHTEYELALRFYNWGNLTGANVQWYKVRDDSGVPPLSAWITQRQLARQR